MDETDSEQRIRCRSWARDLAEYAGVGHVPLVKVEPDDDKGMVITYHFELLHKFEVCQVTMALVQLDFSAHVYKHVDMWLTVQVSVDPAALPLIAPCTEIGQDELT